MDRSDRASDLGCLIPSLGLIGLSTDRHRVRHKPGKVEKSAFGGIREIRNVKLCCPGFLFAEPHLITSCAILINQRHDWYAYASRDVMMTGVPSYAAYPQLRSKVSAE